MTNENMRVIPVPQDVTRYENKVAYGFTLRQLAVIVLTFLVDGTLIYLLNGNVDEQTRNTVILAATCIMIFFLVPVGDISFDQAVPLVYYLYFKYPGERAFKTELSIRIEKNEPEVPEPRKKRKRKKETDPEFTAY